MRSHLLTTPAAALVASLIGLGPAAALDDARQVLIGGGSVSAGTTIYTGPGLSNQWNINFPGPGLGEQAAQVRLPAGTLSTLKVNVTTQNTPTSGTLTVTVRRNGAATVIKCSVAGTGFCNSGKSVTFNNAGGRIAIEVANNFVDPGFITYTYTLEYD